MSTPFSADTGNRGARLIGLCFFILIIFPAAAFRNQPAAVQPSINTGLQRTVLVELFTSEGCSSCPAADELLPQLRQANVFVLEFHVDYWDRLGWKDPFSDPAFSGRQREYARRFRLSSLYTPEAVINGRAEKVGSDGRAIGSLIAAETGDGTAPDNASLQMTAVQTGGKIVVAYTSSDTGAEAQKEADLVYVALVQENAVSKIGAGENRGRTLKHVNIVRELKKGKSGKGTVEFAVPPGMNAAQLGITGWIQEPGNGSIRTVAVARPAQ